jgi:hypothetical protein
MDRKSCLAFNGCYISGARTGRWSTELAANSAPR